MTDLFWKIIYKKELENRWERKSSKRKKRTKSPLTGPALWQKLESKCNNHDNIN